MLPVQLRNTVLAWLHGKQCWLQIRMSYRCGVKCIINASVVAVIALLLLLSGDVELNPGPPKHSKNMHKVVFLTIYILAGIEFCDLY